MGHRTLARSYQDDDTQLEGQDHEKLQMLETYMAMQQSGGNEIEAAEDAPLPSRAEEVDKFMAELVRRVGHARDLPGPLLLCSHVAPARTHAASVPVFMAHAGVGCTDGAPRAAKAPAVRFRRTASLEQALRAASMLCEP